MNTKNFARLALLTALSLILFAAEMALPAPIPVPGAKLGLANVVTVWALYHCTARETLLVLDATTGQNAVHQAEEFNKAAQLTGIVLTKLDGTAKGGIVIAISAGLGVPVKLVGVGEGIDDLIDFDRAAFLEALLPEAQEGEG